eukprot:TRINITY_DN4405_c1_g1_i1.p1 TRINITY_DN4405_c1_g1~~TRINITY_DN4405_c1_g1_i1.p1  ORF type:complete len:1455 (-),score=327.65 TRINITY_DN4405_c1_g1_i1:88-4452(-)
MLQRGGKRLINLLLVCLVFFLLDSHYGARRQRTEKDSLSTDLADLEEELYLGIKPEEGEDEGEEGEDGEGDDDDDDDEDEDEGEPWHLTAMDKLGLQIGYLFISMGLVAGFLLYVYVAHLVAPVAIEEEDDGKESEPIVHGILWGEGPLSSFVSLTVTILGFLNYYSYCVMTEAFAESDGDDEKAHAFRYHAAPDTDPVDFNEKVELASLIILGLITLARFVLVHGHPEWAHYGYTAGLRYCIGNTFMFLELCALIATGVFHFLKPMEDHPNVLWLFLARTMEMMSRIGFGANTRYLKKLYSNLPLLKTMGVFAAVIWVLCAGFYYVTFRRFNEETRWEKALFKYDGEKEEGWLRYESIPSVMWYVLLNLSGEFPLADVHVTFGQKLCGIFVCIFGSQIFSMPIGVLYVTLFESEEEEDEEANDTASREAGGEEEEEEEEITTIGIQSSWRLIAIFLATGFLAGLSVGAFCYYTARGQYYSTLFYYPIYISYTTLAYIDGAVAILFLLEHVYRGSFGWLGLIDFLAYAFGLVHAGKIIAMQEPEHMVSDWLRFACIFRLLKLERYTNSFGIIFDTVKEEKGMLLMTFMLSTLVWMGVSNVFYLTEHGNADGDTQGAYSSMLESGWSELLNLHGEWPWMDYSIMGRGFGVISAIFSVMFFCVPTSIIGEGFQTRVEDSVDEKSQLVPWYEQIRPKEAGGMRSLYDMLYAPADTRAFRYFRALSVLASLVSIMVTLWGTIPHSNDQDELQEFLHGYVKDKEWAEWTEKVLQDVLHIADATCVVWFIIEFFLRVIATKGRHLASFVGLCDILSIIFATFSCIPDLREVAFHPSYASDGLLDDFVIVGRSVRLFCLEPYCGSLHMLIAVVYKNRWPLFKAAGALVPVWFWFAGVLHLLERTPDCKPIVRKPDPDDNDELEQCQRYQDMMRALQYAIVHVTGDYPITEYNFPAKCAHLVVIIAGIAILGCFVGVFAGGFQNFLGAERSRSMDAMLLRRTMIAKRVAQKLQRFHRGRKDGTIAPLPREQLSSLQKFCRSVLTGSTVTGRRVAGFFHITLLLSLVNAMAMSLPEMDENQLYKSEGWSHTYLALLIFSQIYNIIFITEYITYVIARPARMFSFWRVVDLLCILPGIAKLLFHVYKNSDKHPTIEAFIDAFAMMRAIRVLNFPYYRHEMHLIGRSLWDARYRLLLAFYLGFNVWIVTSAVFMWAENYYAEEKHGLEVYEKGNMYSLPATMYWTCIYLTGEWANCDFTYFGTRLCIFYCFFGIGLFSVPLGILTEAVQNVIEQVAVEKADAQQLFALKDHRDEVRKSVSEARKSSDASLVAEAKRKSRVSVSHVLAQAAPIPQQQPAMGASSYAAYAPPAAPTAPQPQYGGGFAPPPAPAAPAAPQFAGGSYEAGAASSAPGYKVVESEGPTELGSDVYRGTQASSTPYEPGRSSVTMPALPPEEEQGPGNESF